jgi:hypothetical protein
MAVRPVKGSGIAGVTPAQREGIMKLFPRRGTGEILRDYEQGIVQGGRSDLVPGGFLPPIPNYVPSKQANTAGQLFLQSLGNLGIDALNVGREASGIMLAAPFAAADIFNAPTDAGYVRSLDDFAQGILDMEAQEAAQANKAAFMARGAGRPPASMGNIAGGPTYTQTPTEADQNAAITAQMRQAQDMGDVSIMPDGSMRSGNIFEAIAGLTSDPYAIEEKLEQSISPDAIAAAQQRAAGQLREEVEAQAGQQAPGRKGTIVSDVTDITDQPDDLVETQASGDVEGVDLGTGTESPAETAFKSGYDAYLEALGESRDIGSIEDYKKEFADATGIDISGKVDNSAALMAFGLALMQNKAGKGFNVGNILSSVGAAGEAALPLMAQAKKEARAAKLAGGKYALEQRKAARANRQALLEAERDRLNELLKQDREFKEKKELEKIKQENAIDLKRIEHEQTLLESEFEGVDLYLDSTEEVPLFEGAGKAFTVNAFKQNPNLPKRYKDKDIPLKLTNSARTLRPIFDAAEKDLNRLEDDLADIAGIALQDGITVQQQVGAGVRSLGRAFGINVDADLSPLEQAKQTLKRIEVRRTAEILGEAGKTISDADRALVTQIVGEIGGLTLTDLTGADAKRLVNRLKELHGIIVVKGRNNLDTARQRLTGTDYDVGASGGGQQSTGMEVGETRDMGGVSVKRTG